MNETIVTRLMILIAFIVAASSFAYYKNQELVAIKANIDVATAKGIDPVAVRCAYATERDMVCMAYAASKGAAK